MTKKVLARFKWGSAGYITYYVPNKKGICKVVADGRQTSTCTVKHVYDYICKMTKESLRNDGKSSLWTNSVYYCIDFNKIVAPFIKE